MNEASNKYKLGSVIQTPLGIGFITEIRVNPGGVWYYIKTSDNKFKDDLWHEIYLTEVKVEEE